MLSSHPVLNLSSEFLTSVIRIKDFSCLFDALYMSHPSYRPLFGIRNAILWKVYFLKVVMSFFPILDT